MSKFILGVLDAGLEQKSGGAFNLLAGLLKSACEHNILIKLIGTSVDLRRLNYGSNVEVLPLKNYSKFLKIFTRSIRALPYAGKCLGSSKLISNAELISTSLGSSISLGDIDWWLYPHCFSPVPNIGNTAAICHDFQHYQFPENFSWLIRRMRYEAEKSLSHVKKIICISNFTRNILLSRYPQFEKKTIVLHNAVSIKVNSSQVKSERAKITVYFTKPFFLYPALDWPHKNHILLLETARILKSEIGPEFQIILTGPRRRGNWLKDQINKYGVSEIVKDLGLVSRSTLTALYCEARALLFPSLYEGFGLPLAEALFCGTPIIASNCTAIPELIGSAGILCNPNSSEDFSEALKKMLFDNQVHSMFSKAAYKRSEVFGWENWWNTFLANIER